jgi:hypothetical protein
MQSILYLRYFISGNSEPKPIKPINHEQPTNRGFFISTVVQEEAMYMTSIPGLT